MFVQIPLDVLMKYLYSCTGWRSPSANVQTTPSWGISPTSIQPHSLQSSRSVNPISFRSLCQHCPVVLLLLRLQKKPGRTLSAPLVLPGVTLSSRQRCEMAQSSVGSFKQGVPPNTGKIAAVMPTCLSCRP